MNVLQDKEALHFLLNRESLLDQIEQFWADALPNLEIPSRPVILSWLAANTVGEVVAGIAEAARKNQAMDGKMSTLHALRFTQTVLTTHRRESTRTRPRLPQSLYTEGTCEHQHSTKS